MLFYLQYLTIFKEVRTMRKGQNINHPKKGSQIKVEPIREQKDIKAIKKLLEGNPVYYALFIVGINTNLRASDLLRIRAGQVRGLKPMDEIELKEKKTQGQADHLEQVLRGCYQ